jgi:hypothetical protein
MEVSGQFHTPAALLPRERAPGTHWIGGWVGPRASLDTVVKRKIPSPCWESNSGTPIVQPVAQQIAVNMYLLYFKESRRFQNLWVVVYICMLTPGASQASPDLHSMCYSQMFFHSTVTG